VTTLTLGGGPRQLTVTVSTVGARLCQITDPRGHEWLVDDGRTEPTSEMPIPFERGTRGGWDDCFPSIDAEADPRGDRMIADHGDFWFRSWSVSAVGAISTTLHTTGITHPLRAEKTVRLRQDASIVEIDYVLTNTSETPYRFLFSGHPLFRWAGDAVLEIPRGGRVTPAFGLPARAGIWPRLDGRDLSRIPSERGPMMKKFFVEWDGSVTLSFVSGRSLTLRQSTDVTPWLGVCINAASWPEHDPGSDWIALEATTSPHDSLEQAIQSGNAFVLDPSERVAWTASAEFR
jgi:hypothetical protein